MKNFCLAVLAWIPGYTIINNMKKIFGVVFVLFLVYSFWITDSVSAESSVPLCPIQSGVISQSDQIKIMEVLHIFLKVIVYLHS